MNEGFKLELIIDDGILAASVPRIFISIILFLFLTFIIATTEYNPLMGDDGSSGRVCFRRPGGGGSGGG